MKNINFPKRSIKRHLDVVVRTAQNGKYNKWELQQMLAIMSDLVGDLIALEAARAKLELLKELKDNE